MTAPTLTSPPPAPRTIDPTTFDKLMDDRLAWDAVRVAEETAVVQFVNEALGTVTTAVAACATAETQAGIATTKAIEAVAAAATAVNAPGTSSPSTTSMSLTAGAKNLTAQTGKAFPRGGSVKVASNADVSNWMVGSVDSYNAATGAMVIIVDANDIKGTGTFADWTISVSGHRGAPAVIPATGITNVIQATSSYTLTATPTALEINPTGYGCTVFLPPATALTPIDPLHAITNQSYFDVRVCDTLGTLLGFIPAKTKSTVALLEPGAVGVWGISNLSKTGIGVKSTAIKLGFFIKVTKIDIDRELILYADRDASYLYGVVYNRTTNTFGIPVLIRAVPIQLASFASSVKAGVDKVLVVSCSSTTAFEAVVLTFNNVTITVNAAASATLTLSMSKFASDCDIVAVGSSFTVMYELLAPQNEIRALSVSGTTVTIGTPTILNGTVAGCMQVVNGNVVIALSRLGTTFYATTYTLTGTTTLTTGTNYTDTNGAFSKIATLPTGRYFVIRDTSATLLTLNGTTITGSHVADATAGGNIIRDAVIVGNNKVLVVEPYSSSDNCNLITDSSGTASKGSRIAATARAVTRNIIYVDGNRAYLSQSSNAENIIELDCSGASPVIIAVTSKTGSDSRGFVPSDPSNGYANALLQKSKYLLHADKFTSTFGTMGDTGTAGEDAHQFANGVTLLKPPLTTFAITNSIIRGVSDSERWASASYDSYLGNSTIIKLECAA